MSYILVNNRLSNIFENFVLLGQLIKNSLKPGAKCIIIAKRLNSTNKGAENNKLRKENLLEFINFLFIVDIAITDISRKGKRKNWRFFFIKNVVQLQQTSVLIMYKLKKMAVYGLVRFLCTHENTRKRTYINTIHAYMRTTTYVLKSRL